MNKVICVPPVDITMVNHALSYAKDGWAVFPVPLGTKRSHKAAKHSGGAKWGATRDLAQIKTDWEKWPDANIGIPTGADNGFFVVDTDTFAAHGKDGMAVLAQWEVKHRPIPDTIKASTPTDGRHYYFKYPDQPVTNSTSAIGEGIDIRGEGGMVLAPPSVKPDGTKYQWLNPPGLFDLADCPDWLLQKIYKSKKKKPKLSEQARPSQPPVGSEKDEVWELLSYIDPNCEYNDWISVLMALHDKYGGSQEGMAVADHWSSLGGEYTPGEVDYKWTTFEVGKGISWPTVPHMAKQGGADLKAIGWKYKRKHLDDLPDVDLSEILKKSDLEAEGETEEEQINLLAPEIIKAAVEAKKAEGKDWTELLNQARDNRCLSEFKKEVTREIKRQKAERRRERESRTEYDVSNPNEYLEIANNLERSAASGEMAFVFGGNAVTVRRMQSAYGRVQARDSQGNKVFDQQGNTMSQPSFTARADIAKAGDWRVIASQLGYFSRMTEEGEIPAAVPGDLISMLDAVAGTTLKPMQGIAQHPVLFRGNLLEGNGVFDAESRLFLQTGSLKIKHWTDAKAAYQFLTEDWLGDFQFATELDKAKSLMMPASLLVAKTDMIDQPGPPIFLETAARAGTGKSLKVSVCHAAITGTPAPVLMYPEAKEEREKVFVTSIMEGASHLPFDNLKTGMTLGNSHPEITALTTSPVFGGRILGVSKSFSGPAGVVVSLTGNNVIVQGDLISRTVEIRHFVPAEQNLAERQFRHSDLMAWTLAHRGEIIGALACILRSGDGCEGKGRFPVWTRLVAEPILKAAGRPTGFYDEWVDAGDADTATSSTFGFSRLMGLMFALTRLGGSTYVMTAAEICEALNKDEHTELRQDIFGSEVMQDVRTVSSYLSRHLDYRADGMTLRRKKENLGDRTGRKDRWVFWAD